MKIRTFIGILGLIFFSVQEVYACTSAIITGKVTPDGRPLMWKHRDTGTDWNHIAFFRGERYAFSGLVNSDNFSGDVWTGINEAGFAIMNTASYNLKDDDVKEMDGEGRLMRMALGVCKDLKDFEHFLDTLTRPMRVEANFGVIDASGGAAYYETNNSRYIKIDVNDEKMAPDGYMIYTNFSFHGRKDEGLGYIRYRTAEILFRDFKKENFTPAHIFAACSRSFLHSLLGYDLREERFSPNRASGFCVEQDFIPRKESAASLVIHGVKPGMNPELTTMWTVLGYPPASVALPVWVKTGEKLPALLAASSRSGHAPLCEKAVALEQLIFPIKRGNGPKYMNWRLLYNDEQNGIMQRLEELENKIFVLFGDKEKEWERADRLNLAQVQELYGEATRLIEETYRKDFNLLFE